MVELEDIKGFTTDCCPIVEINGIERAIDRMTLPVVLMYIVEEIKKLQPVGMNLNDAYEALRQGKTVRRKPYPFFEVRQEGGSLVMQDGSVYRITLKDREATDWEIVEPSPEPTRRHPEPSWSPDLITTNLSFGQALVALKAGKAVKRTDWHPTLAMHLVSDEIIAHYDKSIFQPLVGDLFATDWQVMVE